jgi:transcriptional regulator NrdR family protein
MKMQCFKCGAESRVINTARDKSRVYRNRECLGCGRRWYTEEVENSDPRVTMAIYRIKDGKYKAKKAR